MAYESIKVDIIPGAENVEVLHFSQYDNKRPFFIELFNGGAEFIPESGMSLTLECRKRDGNIVILSDPVMNDNVAEFSTTEQLTACYGDNEAEIKIVDDNDLVIGSANFIINVEKSTTCGGIASESDINNLDRQIEAAANEIVPEVVNEIAPAIVRRETVNRIEEYGGSWVISDIPEAGSYYIIFRHRFIGSEDYTAYRVYSTDPSIVVESYDIPTAGVLRAFLSTPVNIAADYLLQIFKPFRRSTS